MFEESQEAEKQKQVVTKADEEMMDVTEFIESETKKRIETTIETSIDIMVTETGEKITTVEIQINDH